MAQGHATQASSHSKTPRNLKVQVWIYFLSPQDGTYWFLLLLTRPDRGHFWQPVTGSVEANESLEEAAKRETMEESGLSFSREPEPLGEPFEYQKGGKSYLEYPYSLAVDSAGPDLPVVQIAGYEHSEYRWEKAQEALQMLYYSSNVQVLKTLLQRLKVPFSSLS